MGSGAKHRVGRTLAIGLIGLAAGWGLAGAGLAQPTSQQIHDRLLGRDPGTSAAPSDSDAPPDCSTEQALENNPACFNQVSGASRSFSLISPSAPANTTAPPPVRRTGPTGPAPTHAIATIHASRPPSASGGGAAVGCGMRDASDNAGVNLCVTFALNSSVLTAQSKSSLNQLVQALISPDIRGRGVRIDGYADISGAADANQKLSEARAKSVVAYLVTHGLTRDRLEANGYGASHFLPGHTSGDPANRRVEARLKN